ncbi:MAG: hypothetical protein A2776_00915 [Candidatus Levybacteria bacterium RIFCSPHIGHO2_01_FULL_40_10]|nr:MAG: hypothetical protein A2776_00915 [Candidatus Levybacteria bacterium RIFCSPHIGHO2_01_FULL_40_10]
MDISVVIPNYNGEKLLAQNLPKLITVLKDFHGSSEIIISDDASADSSIKIAKNILAESGIKHKIIENKVNKGFSTNIDNGAVEAKGEFIIFLNTDVVPEKNFLIALDNFKSDENLYGVGLMDKSVEGENVVLRGRGLASWSRGFLSHRKGEVDSKDTFWVSGGSCIVRRSMFEKLKGFDTIYDPFYWEDIDLSYRAQKAGFRVIFDNKSIVEHRHEEGAIKKNYSSFQVKKIAYRNQFIFVWKNITDLNLILSHLLWLPFHISNALLHQDIAFLSGLLLATGKIPTIIDKRNKQKKLYLKKDSEIILN